MSTYYGHVKIPLQRVHLELTNVCEFDCTFCPKSKMRRPYGFMETKLAKDLITELKRENVCEKITLHVMGEPTLHPDFFEILDHAAKEQISIGLTTNGAGLGKEIGKKLAKYKLHQVDISLQTPDPESYKLRKAGNLSFEQYLQGILDFFAAYNPQHPDTVFKLRFLNTRFPQKQMERQVGPVRIMSSTQELRSTFKYWSEKLYDILQVDSEHRTKAQQKINKLVAYKWNVVEIYPNVFFETYMLADWGHAFADEELHDAWAGYCYGMRDHFSILYNGDVTLCCVDFDGQTTIGNVHQKPLKEILSSKQLGKIISGFKKFKIVHPYCRRCLGTRTRLSWLFKPFASVLALKLLKPFFYKHVKLF